MKQTGSEKYFSDNYLKYDDWYLKHRKEYSDQLDFLRDIIPHGKGIEIGVGTGRFAAELGIEYGVDRVEAMVRIASERGIKAYLCDAESMPFEDNYFDYAFSIVTLCFLENPEEVLLEERRIAKEVITVILDRNTEYIQNIMSDLTGFYRYATFYTEEELVDIYRKLGFDDIKTGKRDLMTSDGQAYRLVCVSGK